VKSDDARRIERWASRLVETMVALHWVVDTPEARTEVVKLAMAAVARDRKNAAYFARLAEKDAARFAGDPTCRETFRGLKLIAAALRAFSSFSNDPTRSAFRGQAKRDETERARARGLRP
jgi:hypothetical protein